MQPNVVVQFDVLLQRRTLLEALAQLSCNLKSAEAGMSAMQNIILPSQQFSAQLRESLATEISNYKKEENDSLREKLTKLNAVLEKKSSMLAKIVKIDDETFLKHFSISEENRIAFRKLQENLTTFKKQAFHSLAIRIVLQDRGLQVGRSKFALDQDFLAEKLHEIHHREKSVRTRIHITLLEMISDNEQLLLIANGNPKFHSILSQNGENLRASLILVESGASIESLPTIIEEIHYDTLPEQMTLPAPMKTSTPIEVPASDDIDNKNNTSVKNRNLNRFQTTPKKVSILNRIKKWFHI